MLTERIGKPLVVGITGGVGAGKSSVLAILKEKSDCRILIADDIAKNMLNPGGACYNETVSLLSREVLDGDGSINRAKMAEFIYRDPSLRKKVNDIIHPAVNDYIAGVITDERKKGRYDLLFIEAALLIECGYDRICDELWYIYASEDVRRKRLKESRNYSDEKIDGIYKAQLSEAGFREHCDEIIDNNGDEAALEDNIVKILKQKEKYF